MAKASSRNAESAIADEDQSLLGGALDGHDDLVHESPLVSASASGSRPGPGSGSSTPAHDHEHTQHVQSDDGTDDGEQDLIVHHGRASSIKRETSPKTPRSANRVRFDLPDEIETENSSRGNGNAYRLHNANGRDDYHDEDEDLTAIDEPLLPSTTAALLHIDLASLPSWAVREFTRPRSDLRAAFMNMANSIIGAGIIGQPYAFRQAGLLAGVLLLVGLTVTVDWTIRLIVVNSKLAGKSSFQGTVEHCFGKWGLVAVSLAQWAFAFGGMLAYCIIVGDTIPHVMEAIWPGLREMPVWGLLASRRAVIILFVGGISWPLTLYRDIAKLSAASTLALVSMLIILFTIVTQGFWVPSDLKGSFSLPLLTINSGIFQAIGVISFAFVCHHNTLLIYDSLHIPTLDRFATVTHYSTFVSLLACLVMALAGFLTFTSKTQGNVLNNFPEDNSLVNIARFCFGLNMLTTLPLEAFVCREVMLNYFWPDHDQSYEEGSPEARFDLIRHVSLSTGLIWSSIALALVLCDLGVVFELIGATSACALAYILPPMCYIKLSTPSWKTRVAWGVVAFGGVVMVISVTQSIIKMVSGGSSTAECRW